MALVAADRQMVAQRWVEQFFVSGGLTANLTHTDIQAAVNSFDTALDSALSVIGVPLTTTLLATLNAALPAAFSGKATAAQKAALISMVLFRRAGLMP
jgi:hypothetical protein